MKNAVISAVPQPGKQVVEQTTKTTTQIPPSQSTEDPNAPKRLRAKGEHINIWFARMPPDERAHDWVYTLYRDDSRIIIVDENLDDRASGTMLYKFLPDEIKAIPEGPFLTEMGQLISERFGGGEFHLMVQNRKLATLKYNKGLKLAGEPKLSSREGWKDGQYSGNGSDGMGAVVPQLLQMIREEIRGVKDGSQSPQNALALVMDNMLKSNAEAFKFALDRQPKPMEAADRLIELEKMFSLFDRLAAKNPAPAPAAPPPTLAQQLQDQLAVQQLLKVSQAPTDGALTPASIAGAVKDAITPLVSHAPGRGIDWTGIAQSFFSLATSPLGMAIANRLSSVMPNKRGVVIQRQPQPGAPGFVDPNQNPNFNMPSPGGMAPSVAPIGVVPGGPGAPINGPMQPPAAPPSSTATPVNNNGQIEIDQATVDAVVMDHARHRILDMFQHDGPGNVAAGYIQVELPQLAAYLRFLKSETDLERYLANDPILKTMIGDPRLPEFMSEFLGYFQEAEQGQEE